MPRTSKYRFGVFEVNLQARELRKHGVRVKLRGQPFEILSLLIEHPGEIVTREQLRERLWHTDTFVDFEHSLNTAVRKLRAVLGDSPENSRYLETLPRVGYRFIAPVSAVDVGREEPEAQTEASLTERPTRHNLPGSPAPLFRQVGPLNVPEKERHGLFRRNKLLIIPFATLALFGTLYFLRPTVPPPKVLRIRQITHLGTVEAQQNLVTDGPRVYFRDMSGGQRSLKYVARDGGEAYLLPNSSPEFDIDGISPDGSKLLVASVLIDGNNPVWVLSTGGGGPQRVGNTRAIDSAWSGDGRRLAYMTAESVVFAANADGSESRKLADVPGTPYCPRWSPDSTRLRFVVIRSATGPTDLWEVTTDGKGKAHPLLPGWGPRQSEWGGSWSPDGKYFFLSSSLQSVKCVWALRQKTDWWHRVSWVPEQLTAGPVSYSLPCASRDGKTLFVIGEERKGELLRYEAKTRKLTPFLPKFSADHVSFSRDGQWMAYVQYPEGTLWRSKLDGTERLQLSVPPLRAYLPRWSPDGKWIAFAGIADIGQPPKLYRVPADGQEPTEQLVKEGASGWCLDWSADGSAIVYGGREATGAPEAAEISILDLKTKKSELVPGSRGLLGPQWSPDGRYLAARHVGSKRLKLYDFRSGQWTDLGVDNAEYQTWSRDGTYICFNTFFATDRSIYRLRVADRKLEKLYTLKDVIPAGIYGTWSAVAPDGSPLILRDAGTRDIYAIDLELP